MADGTRLRIGIAGCGRAARIHLDRLLGLPEVDIVGCADPDLETAKSFAAVVSGARGSGAVPSYGDHRELLLNAGAEALFVFTPHRSHYQLAMDALQAGCHLFIEKPLSTNVQEATDILGLARGRGLRVAVGHQYRLCPSLGEARRLLAEGAIGPLRLVTAILAQPWLARLTGREQDWRADPRVAGGGVVADVGDHLLDALLWTTGRCALDVYAVQTQWQAGLDIVTAATIRLSDETPVNLSVSGVAPDSLFELNYFGERGRLRATDQVVERGATEPGAAATTIPLSRQSETIDGNFVTSILHGAPLCCPVDEAIDTVRLLEAIMRSSAAGQVVPIS